MKVNPLLLAALCLASPAVVAAPRVVADIPPVHALASALMRGVGAPELILPPGASPHGYAMRPSEAARLESADLVFWIGEGLTRWLETAIGALAKGATVVELMAAEGLRLLPFREGATFEAHDHDLDHGAEAKADDHDHDHAAKDDAHNHVGADPHVWLDPVNAALMAGAMTKALIAADPENAAIYSANLRMLESELAALVTEVAALVAPARGKPFVVFHDAYHYFEARFDVEAAGAIAVSDAAAPGPARLDEMRSLVRDLDVVCVFAEPQFDPKLADLVVERTEARVAVLDPLGAGLEPGPALYSALIRGMGAALSGCLTRTK